MGGAFLERVIPGGCEGVSSLSPGDQVAPARRLWRPVTRAICEGDQQRATQEKLALEEAQRRREQGQSPWTPKLFQLDPTTHEWRYQHEK